MFASSRSRAKGLSASRSADRYDAVTVALHWTTAAFVAALWIVGQTADWLPKGGLRTFVWSSHVAFGFAFVAIFVLRVVWRLAFSVTPPPAETGMLNVVAKTTHVALYGMLSAAIGLGVANAFIRGHDLYHLFRLPQVGDPALKRQVTDWHGVVANAVMALAAFHAAAALTHHYAWFDGLISRMSIGRRR